MSILHLIHGVSAAGSLRQTGRREAVGGPGASSVPWREPPGVGLDRWRAAWRDANRAHHPEWRLHQLDRLLRALESKDHQRLEVWTGPSLDEQLWQIVLVRLLEEFPPREVWLQEITAPIDLGPDGQARALAALGPDRLAALGGSPRPLEANERALLLRAWQALIAPEPLALVALLSEGHTLLRPLARLAWRFPEATTGLAACELDLLAALADDDRASRAVALACFNGRDLPELDLDPRDSEEVVARLLALSDARSRHPLVRLTDAEGDLLRPHSPARGRLTPLGREVLEGRRCYLDLGDYRAKICGFEVDASRPPVWRNDAGRLVRRG